MKKNIHLAFLLSGVLVTLLFSGCGKYEDGPGFSLLTKKQRLCRRWEVETIQDENGNSISSEDSDYYFDFEKDGNFTAQNPNGAYSGDWSFVSDKEEVQLQYYFGTFAYIVSYRILRLTNDELWVKDEDNNTIKLESD